MKEYKHTGCGGDIIEAGSGGFECVKCGTNPPPYKIYRNG